MTTPPQNDDAQGLCPAEELLKSLAGRWKPSIFRMATQGPVRFNALLRQLEGASRQSLSVALREMEEDGLLREEVVRQKPLHVEHRLTPKAESLVAVFLQLEQLR